MKKLIITLGMAAILGTMASACDKPIIQLGQEVEVLVMQSDNAYNMFGDKELCRDKLAEAVKIATHCATDHKDEYPSEQAYYTMGVVLGQLRQTLDFYNSELAKEGK